MKPKKRKKNLKKNLKKMVTPLPMNQHALNVTIANQSKKPKKFKKNQSKRKTR